MANQRGGIRVPVEVWMGRILSGLIVLLLLTESMVNFFMPDLLRPMMQQSGFPERLGPVLGAIELVCAVVYAVPRTANLGAILVTGFLGGAIQHHFRLGEVGSPTQFYAVLLGLMTWGGLWLRNPALRAFLPLSAAARRDT